MQLVWDKVDERRYETGIEHGVIYPIGGSAIVWNGLVSVAETKSRESKVYYQDGIKVLERLIAPSYSAKISAFTYPDVLDELAGNLKLAPGVDLHEQREGQFHLSYRTRIGSMVDGLDHGYKLHLLYNLVVNPDDTTHDTVSDSPGVSTFGWTVSSVHTLWGARPVNHISIDSTSVDPARLTEIENELYGTAGTEPGIPDLITLLNSF